MCSPSATSSSRSTASATPTWGSSATAARAARRASSPRASGRGRRSSTCSTACSRSASASASSRWCPLAPRRAAAGRASSCWSPTRRAGTTSTSATRCRSRRRGGAPRRGWSPSACAISSTRARRGLAIAVAAAREAGRDVWWALEAAFAEGEDAEWLARLEPEDARGLGAFCPRFADERRRAGRLALDELLDRAIAASGYDVHVLGLLGGARRMANVDKLMRLAREFEAAEGRDLRAFVDHAAALEQAQRREPEAPVDDGDADAVRLMTIHAAKGLEFDVVVVGDLGRRGNLQTPDLLVEGDRLGLRLALLDGRSAAPALAYDELKDRRLLTESHEEDRVFYVALTRARERLLPPGAADPPPRH